MGGVQGFAGTNFADPIDPLQISDHLSFGGRRQNLFESTDGYSALMFVCAMLRHVASKASGTLRYMSMSNLDEMQKEATIRYLITYLFLRWRNKNAIICLDNRCIDIQGNGGS